MKSSRISNWILLVFLAGLGVVALSGCHTAHGFGEDVERAGQEIQKGTE